MKQVRNIALLLLVLGMLFAAVGCQTVPEETTEPTVETTEDNRQEEIAGIYNAAVEALNGEEQGYQITYEKTTTVAGLSYSESGEQSVDFWNIGTEDFLAKVKETVTYGDKDYELEWQEIYSAGNIYQTLSEGKFKAEMTAEDYMARFHTGKLFDTGLYTLSTNEDGTVISLEEAVAGESWLVPEDAQFLSASGSVELDEEGNLIKSAYTVAYTYGAAKTEMTYEVTVKEAGRKPSAPENTEEYVLLKDIQGAYLMEHAYGYLSQAQTLEAMENALILSAAGGCSLLTNVDLSVYNQDDAYAMRWEHSLNFSDYSSGSESSYEQEETFIDGKYSISTDGGRPETNTAITQQTVEGYINSHLVEWFFDINYIADAEITAFDSVILVEYTGSEDLALALCKDICSDLFNSGDVLNEMASSYQTDEMSFYLALDAYSMLPTAMGFMYEGTHVIQRQKCVLSQQVDRLYNLGSMDAYYNIHEEHAQEEEPENPAKPLFYRVTGENGEQMWLFGTIHLGDERTAYLPDEIYDAFYASDALAIECDVDAFSDRVEEDEDLQKKLSESYFFSDGSTLQEHIDTPDLYEDAVKMLKATGEYYYNSEHSKAYLWSSSIDDFYLRQGYSLTREKGVENRLMKLAEEDDMPIWDVEDPVEHNLFVLNYSDHLLEFILFCSVAGDAQEYWEETQELYERWCEGDEETLKEEIADEPWVLEEEDFDLESLTGEALERAQAAIADLENINAKLAEIEQEYNQAMSTDRNAIMVDKAKEYLESGDTVFYAVGLAHLLEEDGLINGLRDAGYTVELVEYQ